ncbi:MAG TPA: carboxypeptidase-like regulatory domain-containing protein, partial [Polyangiaceae bacterium]
MLRVLAQAPLILLLLALGTITDTPLFAVLFEMAPPPLPASVTDRDATVTVTTHDDHGEAIRGARVIVLADIDDKVYRAGGGRTDASGVAKIPSLPRGHAWIVADAEGHARSSTSLVLIGDRSIELVLGPEHTFVVNVVDAEGRGVANAEIEVSGADPLPYGARTDASGRAEVGRLGDPPWVVTARALGYDESTARGVRDGAAIKLVLHRLGSITVHVVDSSDKPVQNARVRIAGTALWPSREGHTGPKGGVKLAGLFAGSYSLRASEGTRASATEIGVMLAAGEDQELTLRLLPGRMVTVRVTDGDADDADD